MRGDDGALFPPVEEATAEGLLAVGGDLGVERLLEAYARGIFPWYSPGQPILWWSPDPRVVLYPGEFRVSRSLRRTLRRGQLDVSLDTDFEHVLAGCAAPRGESAAGTWITRAMREAYCRLHEEGFAHSIEVRRRGQLVGGLYGVSLGQAFFGESMFSRATDASKVALAWLVAQLRRWGFRMIDCQLPSDHLFRLGARAIPRDAFVAELSVLTARPTRVGRWSFDDDLDPPGGAA